MIVYPFFWSPFFFEEHFNKCLLYLNINLLLLLLVLLQINISDYFFHYLQTCKFPLVKKKTLQWCVKAKTITVFHWNQWVVMVEFEHFRSLSLAVLWAIMARHSRNSTSVFSAPVGWSITTQYSACPSLICRLSTLSLSRVFYFLIVYLWQQNNLLFPCKNRQSGFCIYSGSRLFIGFLWVLKRRLKKNPHSD